MHVTLCLSSSIPCIRELNTISMRHPVDTNCMVSQVIAHRVVYLTSCNFILDTLTLYLDGVAEIPVTKTGIAWPTDLTSKFKNPTDWEEKGCDSEGKSRSTTLV